MHKTAFNKWQGAGIYLFNYFVIVLFAMTIHIAILRPMLGLQNGLVFDFSHMAERVISILLQIIAMFFAVKFTKVKFIFYNEKYVPDIAAVYFSLFIFLLYFQAYLRGLFSQEYTIAVFVSLFNILVFYIFSKIFWSAK